MLRPVIATWLVLSIGVLFSVGAFAEPQRAPETGAVENLEVERGATVIQLDHETALMVSPGGGFQLPGAQGFGLTLCRCVKKDWDCRVVGGENVCSEICVEWKCKKLPAPAP